MAEPACPEPAPPLTYAQVVNVVERRGGDIPRVPFFWHKYWGNGTRLKYGEALDRVAARCADDLVEMHYTRPGDFDPPEGAAPGYVWAVEPKPADFDRRGITTRTVVSDVERIDEFIEKLPDQTPPAYYDQPRAAARENPGRYCIAWDFFALFERAWFLFGMENILCEMLAEPERMGRLLDAIAGWHMTSMEHLAAAGAHGYFTSDDLGTQTGLIFSREIFREMYLPRYEAMVDRCHALGMHFWLHSCGAITELLDDFVAIGVDVIHPVQPHAMDQAAVAKAYRGKITFLAGLDVQYLLPRGTAAEVEAGTKALIDAFDHPEGGLIFAVANGVMPETPLENIEAYLMTAQRYGAVHRRGFRD